MITEIEAGAAITRNLNGRDHLDVRVMPAIRQVSREVIVLLDMCSAAFRDGESWYFRQLQLSTH